MIKLNSFFKSFGSRKILRGIDLEINSGEIVTLIQAGLKTQKKFLFIKEY